jgi:hypothetical protein
MGGVFGNTTVPAQYQPQVLASAARWGVPPAFLAAQLNTESGFNPNAVSPDGAIGLAQFMPSTARSVGLNPRDPNASIDAMAKLMSSYKKTYGSWEKALYAYHGGPGIVDKPGPASRSYAEKILGIVDGKGLGWDIPGFDLPDALTPDLSSPFKATEKVFDRLDDPDFWKRIGMGLGGALAVAGGIAFIIVKGAI